MSNAHLCRQALKRRRDPKCSTMSNEEIAHAIACVYGTSAERLPRVTAEIVQHLRRGDAAESTKGDR